MHRCQSHSQCVGSVGIHTIKLEINLPCGSYVSAIVFLPAEQQRKVIETINKRGKGYKETIFCDIDYKHKSEPKTLLK